MPIHVIFASDFFNVLMSSVIFYRISPSSLVHRSSGFNATMHNGWAIGIEFSGATRVRTDSLFPLRSGVPVFLYSHPIRSEKPALVVENF